MRTVAGCQWLTSVIPATQEDPSLKSARANSSQDRITKRAGGVAQGESPKFKPQYHKKKKKKKRKKRKEINEKC
jgi:hypothetical protein